MVPGSISKGRICSHNYNNCSASKWPSPEKRQLQTFAPSMFNNTIYTYINVITLCSYSSYPQYILTYIYISMCKVHWFVQLLLRLSLVGAPGDMQPSVCVHKLGLLGLLLSPGLILKSNYAATSGNERLQTWSIRPLGCSNYWDYIIYLFAVLFCCCFISVFLYFFLHPVSFHGSFYLLLFICVSFFLIVNYSRVRQPSHDRVAHPS